MKCPKCGSTNLVIKKEGDNILKPPTFICLSCGLVFTGEEKAKPT
jgi:uncharacterized Zn finger protein